METESSTALYIYLRYFSAFSRRHTTLNSTRGAERARTVLESIVRLRNGCSSDIVIMQAYRESEPRCMPPEKRGVLEDER
jgi:hypothetical protein